MQNARRADGWFTPATSPAINPDGYLHITDRAKDVIKSGGEWISSWISRTGLRSPGRADGGGDRRAPSQGEERPLLIVVPCQGRTPTRDSLLAHIAQHFAKWQLPDEVLLAVEHSPDRHGQDRQEALRQKYGDHLMTRARA